ncbi:MAG: hypothetical protein IT337_07760 [Thermomicrobiales bacterium]|nr:hypothetical protein [Thermomicrobiales bacterium]
MDEPTREQTIDRHILVELSRRRLLAGAGSFAVLTGLGLPLAGGAQSATPIPAPVAKEDLDALIGVSRTLSGGGNFNADQATMLWHLLAADPALKQGLDELLASPPVDPRLSASATSEATPAATPQPVTARAAGVSGGADVVSPQRQAASQAILLFWYAGIFGGDPIANRSTAYYGLTAWQAMYTPTWAICKAYGAWADPPSIKPLAPANT